jgi:hypothetical protein
MFKLDTEKALLDSFRPKDRQLVEISKEVKLPQFVRTYLSWKHPSGSYVYLVFAVPGGAPTGIVFDSNGGGAEPMNPAMCDWCHCTGRGTEVGLLTARLNRSKRIGVHVCTDLGCKEKLEDECLRAGRSVVPAMEKLLSRIGRFASEGLQIDLSGAGR